MRYEPKILVNRTGKVVEFKCGGVTYIHQKGKKKPYEGFPAHHALHVTNTGLEEYIEGEAPVKSKKKPSKKNVIVTREELMKTPWKTLLKIIGKKKKFTPGMNKEQIVDILMNE